MSYTWTADNITSSTTCIHEHEQPTRFALTTTALFLSIIRGQRCLMLANPHPTTWNSWMLPYGALIHEVSLTTPRFDTLSTISLHLESLQNADYISNTKAEVEGISKLLGISETALAYDTSRIVFKNYSLKYSQSSNIWSAYLFQYINCQIADGAEPSCETIWVELSPSNIRELLSNRTLNSIPLAENVLSLISESTVDFGDPRPY